MPGLNLQIRAAHEHEDGAHGEGHDQHAQEGKVERLHVEIHEQVFDEDARGGHEQGRNEHDHIAAHTGGTGLGLSGDGGGGCHACIMLTVLALSTSASDAVSRIDR